MSRFTSVGHSETPQHVSVVTIDTETRQQEVPGAALVGIPPASSDAVAQDLAVVLIGWNLEAEIAF